MKTITVKINVPDDMPEETAYRHISEAIDMFNEEHPEKSCSLDMNHASMMIDVANNDETQLQKVKRILDSGQQITSEEAINDLGIPRLSAVIYEIKSKYRYDIVRERKKVSKYKSIVVYSLAVPQNIDDYVVVRSKAGECSDHKGTICVFSDLSRFYPCSRPDSIPMCNRNAIYLLKNSI